MGKERHDVGRPDDQELSMGKRGDAELYDIVHDPLCMNNLHGVAEYGVLEKTLEKEMTERLKSQGDPRMYGRGDIFDKYPNMCKSRMYWNRTRAGEEVPATWITPTDFDPL